MEQRTITLPDGYNGHTVECFAEPIERDGNLVKLRVVSKHYLIKWAHVEDVSKAVLFSIIFA